jgi:hypothetical protein
MARLFTSLGIPCGHEAIFDWRGYRWAEKRLNGDAAIACSSASSVSLINGKWLPEPAWVDPSQIVAESSYLAAPFLQEPILDEVPVIHVVRHPVKVINSFCNYLGYFQSNRGQNSYEQIIYRWIPELKKQMPPYDRAALYYVLWNDLIDLGRPNLFHRIEDGIAPVLEFLGTNGECYNNTKINSQAKSGPRFAFEDIESQEIRQRVLEKCFQYEYPSPEGLMIL